MLSAGPYCVTAAIASPARGSLGASLGSSVPSTVGEDVCPASLPTPGNSLLIATTSSDSSDSASVVSSPTTSGDVLVQSTIKTPLKKKQQQLISTNADHKQDGDTMEKQCITGPSSASTEETLAFARRVLKAEAEAIASLQIDERMAGAAELFAITASNGGSVVVSGMGKSGHIGNKISATLASIGIPSLFLHPSEAFHGDLGRVRTSTDCVLLLSYGGGTEEVVSLAQILKKEEVPMVAITRSSGSALGRLVDHCLEIGQVSEACPHNLAPTTSTTATLAMGDAVALCASRIMQFQARDFHRCHPSGSLGKQLMPVSQVMRFRTSDNSLPLVHENLTVAEALAEVSLQAKASGKRRAGATLAVNTEGKLTGIFTDGDLRRLVTENPLGGLSLPLSQVMTKTQNIKFLTTEQRVRDAVHIVRELGIDEVPVLDSVEGLQPLGMIDVQDLVALKVMDP